MQCGNNSFAAAQLFGFSPAPDGKRPMRKTALLKKCHHTVFSETALYQKLRRIRRCSSEVASRAFWQMTRFGLCGFSHLAKPGLAPVRSPLAEAARLLPKMW
jgi:hypothetical protein